MWNTIQQLFTTNETMLSSFNWTSLKFSKQVWEIYSVNAPPTTYSIRGGKDGGLKHENPELFFFFLVGVKVHSFSATEKP